MLSAELQQDFTFEAFTHMLRHSIISVEDHEKNELIMKVEQGFLTFA